MVICSLDALRKPSKKKETRIKKEIVEVLQQPSYRQKQPSRGVLLKRCSPVNFVKFLRTPFFIDYLWRRLLYRKKRTGN